MFICIEIRALFRHGLHNCREAFKQKTNSKEGMGKERKREGKGKGKSKERIRKGKGKDRKRIGKGKRKGKGPSLHKTRPLFWENIACQNLPIT